MRKINITVISVVVGVTLFIILTMLEGSIIKSEPLATVIVSNVDVLPDTELKREMFSEIKVPIYLTLNSKVLSKIDEISGKFSRESIHKGQIMFQNDIGSIEELKILVSTSGTEKVAIELSEPQNAVSYQIKAKDKVNIYFSGRYGAIKDTINQFGMESIEKEDNSIYTTCLLRDTEIIGVFDEYGKSITHDSTSNPNTIVIATDSKTATLINNLRSQGRFDLTK